ncbi:MAG: hypothetical protein GX811_07230, partial [Lentisphaerae bacterium]|nr:hypothetical protein [Lentisphaerota bacterium]
MSIQAGFAEIDITPPLGTAKIGWLTEIIIDKIHDPVFARAAVFVNGGQKIGFIQLDLLSIRWSQVDRIRKLIEEKFG